MQANSGRRDVLSTNRMGLERAHQALMQQGIVLACQEDNLDPTNFGAA